MQLRVEFAYPFRYVPFRCQSPRTGYLRGATDVGLREVAAADVVPAFRVSGAADHARLRPLRDGGPRTLVAWGGRLWSDTGLDADRLARMFEGRDPVAGTPLDAVSHTGPAADRGIRPHYDAARFRNENGGPPREWGDDGGAAMAARLARRAADLVLVGGRLHVREYEPCWVRTDRGGTSVLSVDTSAPDPFDPFVEHYRRDVYGARGRWRADRLDEAVSEGARVEGRIEVLEPSEVRFADDCHAMTSLARAAAAAVAPALQALPADRVEAFMDLRDALAASRGGIGPALPRAVAALAELPPDGLPGWRKGAAEAATAWGAGVAACRTAAARWERRPADGREWVEEGLPLSLTREGGSVVREVLHAEALAVLARGLGRDLSRMDAAVAAGEGRVLAIGWSDRDHEHAETADRPGAAVLVSRDPGRAEALHVTARADADEAAAIAPAVARALAHVALASRVPNPEPASSGPGGMP